MHSEANISVYDLHDSYLPQVHHWMICYGYRWFRLPDSISLTRVLHGHCTLVRGSIQVKRQRGDVLIHLNQWDPIMLERLPPQSDDA
jgi:hypothetical protein|eukprot:COSAG02_NODE_4249_length_5586_cov_14.082377_5_plen_87_part_00